MNIEAKCRIIADAWIVYRQTDDAGWLDLIFTYDLAFPFALGVVHGFISLNESGVALIEECWDAMCGMMGVDPEGIYADYSEWIDTSPNEVI